MFSLPRFFLLCFGIHHLSYTTALSNVLHFLFRLSLKLHNSSLIHTQPCVPRNLFLRTVSPFQHLSLQAFKVSMSPTPLLPQ